MKLHIAVCDDEATETEYLSGLTQKWAAFVKVSAAVSSYDSAEAFLFAYDTDKSFDILLLDIQMKTLDGITLAKQLRAKGEKMQIIFITGLPDFIAEGYEVSALHYLMKPIAKEKLFNVLDKAVSLLDKAEETILLDTESGRIKFLVRNIVYAESFAHITSVETTTGVHAVKLSIGELETILGEDFSRVHRSYLVGLRHIRQITKTDVIMDNGKTIPLSRRRYAAVNQEFIQYYKGAE